jgi:hypothetical protein
MLAMLALARARKPPPAPVFLPTFTALGPPAPQALTGAFVAVAGASIAVGVLPVGQKAIITYSVQTAAGAGAADQALFRICDGLVTVPIDSFEDDVGNSTIEVAEASTVSWTTEFLGDGAAHTFLLAAREAAAPGLTIPANRCRAVVQIVGG